MTKVLMLYTSLTGNTEIMAKAMIYEINNHENIQLDTKLFDDNEIETKDLLNYDIIFIGVYTWVGGDVPMDCERFFDDLYKIDLTGKVFGVFGSADSDYPDFGTAVTMFHEQLEKLGGTMIPDQLISDMDPTNDELERCRQMVKKAIEGATKPIQE